MATQITVEQVSNLTLSKARELGKELNIPVRHPETKKPRNLTQWREVISAAIIANEAKAPITDLEIEREVMIAEVDGHIIAEGKDEVELLEVQEFAKTLPGNYWVELASEWFLDEAIEGFVVGFGGTVQTQVNSLIEARLYLSRQEGQQETQAQGEVIIEPLHGVEFKQPQRGIAANAFAAMTEGATAEELLAIDGHPKTTIKDILRYVCRRITKSCGCELRDGKYYLVMPN